VIRESGEMGADVHGGVELAEVSAVPAEVAAIPAGVAAIPAEVAAIHAEVAAVPAALPVVVVLVRYSFN
jgi:hypothetical protein